MMYNGCSREPQPRVRMAFTSVDLASVDAAIIALATKEAASVTSNGQTVVYKRDDIPALLQLRNAIQQSIDASSSNGGMFLIKPMGRTYGEA